MYTQKLRNIIKMYKENFARINREEIYKWQAVKQFQDNWDIEAPDFHEMLKLCLSKSENLLDSKRYLPRRMMNFFTERDPERVRNSFRELFNEDLDLIKRIENFQATMKAINIEFDIKENYFQDLRAVVVYLCLMYPDRYYFYKYEMVKDFVTLVDYPVKPIAGRTSNISEYQSLCEIIKAELVKDSELLNLHRSRITENEYHDSSFNILTQDLIYAAVRNIGTFKQDDQQTSAKSRLIKTEVELNPVNWQPKLEGRFTNYVENEKEKKRIGDLGELLVLQYEKEKLISWGITKDPEHTAKTKGDGLGYDILSYDRQENEIYIEVKTTRGDCNTPFYITGNEKERSNIDRRKFFLYRLYNYNEDHNTANFCVRGGDLSELCGNPILYRVVL